MRAWFFCVCEAGRQFFCVKLLRVFFEFSLFEVSRGVLFFVVCFCGWFLTV